MPSAKKRKVAAASSAGRRSVGKPSTKIDFAINDSEDSDLAYSGDDHVHSDDEDSMGVGGRELQSSDEEEDEAETADAKRIRLAREYLRKMEEKVGGEGGVDASTASSSAEESEESDEDVAGAGAATAGLGPRDRVSRALARERLKREGALERRLAVRVGKALSTLWEEARTSATAAGPEAESRAFVDSGTVRLFRGHDLTTTCVALHMPTGDVAYSASKDNSVLMWDIEQGTKVATVCSQWKSTDRKNPRGNGEVLALACSDDGRYLAAGSREGTVRIFDVRISGKGGAAPGVKSDLVTTFRGHKGPITSLTFRSQSLQLFSGSEDRCIRHYNLEEMAYVETLYGHQAPVTGVACPRRERPISTGRDRTVRAWKLSEETHLIFRGGGRVSSADCVSAVNDDWFLTGHDDGNLNLWLADKKRAVATVAAAHGCDKSNPSVLPRGVSCCDVLPGSDLAATGSCDGYLRLWNVSTGSSKEERSLGAIGTIPLHGYINGVAIGPRGRFCVAATGQEPRLGRWDRVPRAKNRFVVVKLRGDEEKEDEADDAEDNVEEADKEESSDSGEESSSS